MLEGLAARVLKAYIGKYVSVNADKLSVGLLSGVVELENVPLKTDAFNDSDLPFELKCGYVGKIKLTISLNSLRYTPWLLNAENICIIIGPKDSASQARTDDDEDKLQQVKLDKLINLENKWFKEVEFLGVANGTAGEEQSRLFSILSPIAYSLIKNLHVSLNHIHIRYEDNVNGFSMGAYIDSISFQNDNETESQKNLSFKTCQVNNFSIYTDTNCLFEKSLDRQVIFELMNFEKISAEINEPAFKYLLQPTSLKAQIIRDMSLSPLRKRNKPRIKINSSLKEFHLNINPEQIKYAANIIKLVNINNNRLSCSGILNRPTDLRDLVDGRAHLLRQWWFYVGHCVRLKLKKPQMKDLIDWTRDVNLYRRIYEHILKTRFNQNLTTTNVSESNELVVVNTDEPDQANAYNLPIELFNEKKRIEVEWSFKRLVLIRRVIFESFVKNPVFKEYLLKLKQTNLSSSQVSSSTSPTSGVGVYGYLSWSLTNLKDYYFGVAKPADAQTPIETSEHNQVDDEVLALISDSIENDSLLRRDSLLAHLEFKLESASIIMSSETGTQLAEFKFARSTLLFEALPRHDSFFCQINLGSFYLCDCQAMVNKDTLRKNYFPVLIHPKSSLPNMSDITGHDEFVFQIIYEHNPLQNIGKKQVHHTGANLVIKSCGLDIIYNIELLDKIKEFFRLTAKYMSSANRVLIKRAKRSSFKNDLNASYHNSPINKINFNFEITAPRVIFPQDFFTQNPLVVIFDFGRLALINRNHSLNAPAEIVFKKSKTEANLPRKKHSFDNGKATDSLGDSVGRRNSDTTFYLSTSRDVSDGDTEDEDEIFVTPSSTPSNGAKNDTDQLITNASNFYTVYDLHLNELQTVIGKYESDNLQLQLNKGHSDFHFLEKFDITVQIDVFKFKLTNKVVSGEWTPLKINVKLKLLKLDIDDIKLVHICNTLENIQKCFDNTKPMDALDEEVQVTAYEFDSGPKEFLNKNDSNSGGVEFNTCLLNYINLNVDEIDMTMSVAAKSICELKIFDVNSEYMTSSLGNKLVRFRIYGLLLIDARQIYGTDYQLLAASHDQIEIDSKTGRITERNLESQKNASKKIINPLINIDLIINIGHKSGRNKEYILKASFSMLDIILNPETISELIMLYYFSYLNINNKENKMFIT